MSSTAQVIVVCSQKAGSGKTTLSGHIAFQAQHAAAGPVALIDTDPNDSPIKPWNARHVPVPAFARHLFPNSAATLCG